MIEIQQTDNLQPQQEARIRFLVESCADDFCPSLRCRTGSSQQNFSRGNGTDSVEEYLREMLGQKFLLAVEQGQILSFLTYKTGYSCPDLAGYAPCDYATTMITDPARRGEGIGALLYTALENRPDRSRFIGTRTWSTNTAQMHIFPKRGWKAVCVKKNDRGEGIDTVYFVHEKEERPLPLQP